MDLSAILKKLENCPCGKKHTFDLKRLEIGSGIKAKAGGILREEGFPDRMLFVADKNTLKAADGLETVLRDAGFILREQIFENMNCATSEAVDLITELARDEACILSCGTGSLNDICRVVAFQMDKLFCIFATAPSMDGFASDTAPIIKNSFKSSWQARQPDVILADTAILAAAPGELKAAGFGDMVAKYVGLADWRIAHLLIDEYYCPNVAQITESALEKITALSNRVQCKDEETAGAVMEALVMTGLAMKLAGCSRPASGAEHIVSHYLECWKVIRGIWPEYHGKKVGVATVLINGAYRKIATEVKEVNPVKDPTDWDLVYSKYDPELLADVKRLNSPTIADKVDPEKLKRVWPQIREIILTTLPENEKLIRMMKEAGAATTPEEVHVTPELLRDALRYHPYMRYRLFLTRLLPMLGLDIMDWVEMWP